MEKLRIDLVNDPSLSLSFFLPSFSLPPSVQAGIILDVSSISVTRRINNFIIRI